MHAWCHYCFNVARAGGRFGTALATPLDDCHNVDVPDDLAIGGVVVMFNFGIVFRVLSKFLAWVSCKDDADATEWCRRWSFTRHVVSWLNGYMVVVRFESSFLPSISSCVSREHLSSFQIIEIALLSFDRVE
jgi:hypothetical protein